MASKKQKAEDSVRFPNSRLSTHLLLSSRLLTYLLVNPRMLTDLSLPNMTHVSL